MKLERIVLNEERNVTLTAYIQEVEGEFGFSKRPAMLVLPGGGYAMCSDRETDAAALSYAKAGYQTFILRYTIHEKGQWPLPLEDYEQAMELIKEKLEEWHIAADKIAVAGFSAGGHLAACAATIAQHRPAAAVLVYPAIIKEIVDMIGTNMPCPNERVTTGTCPCFLAAARDDRTVDIKNSLLFELALAENGVPFESHIYSCGGHGFSTAEAWVRTNSASARLPEWVENSIGWLKEILGELTYNGFVDLDIDISTNGNSSPVLGVSCTIAHIRKQSDQVQELLKPVYDGLRAVAEARGFQEKGLMQVIGANTLREIMEMLQMKRETIQAFDKELHGIVNRI